MLALTRFCTELEWELPVNWFIIPFDSWFLSHQFVSQPHRPKSVLCNRSFFVASLCCHLTFIFCWHLGFYYRTKSYLFLFLFAVLSRFAILCSQWIFQIYHEKKEEIWLMISPMTKSHCINSKLTKQSKNAKTPPKLRLHNECGPTKEGQLERRQQPSLWS